MPAILQEHFILLHFLSCSFSDMTGFYHYRGSLTIPECGEIVQWIIIDNPLIVKRAERRGLPLVSMLTQKIDLINELHVSFSQLNALRRNVDENGNNIQDNFRPTQAIYDRTVFYSSLNAGKQCPEPSAPKKGLICNPKLYLTQQPYIFLKVRS